MLFDCGQHLLFFLGVFDYCLHNQVGVVEDSEVIGCLGIVGSGIMGSELVKVARLVAPDMQFRVKSTTAERAADFKSHYADDDKVQTSDDLAILAGADQGQSEQHGQGAVREHPGLCSRQVARSRQLSHNCRER